MSIFFFQLQNFSLQFEQKDQTSKLGLCKLFMRVLFILIPFVLFEVVHYWHRQVNETSLHWTHWIYTKVIISKFGMVLRIRIKSVIILRLINHVDKPSLHDMCVHYITSTTYKLQRKENFSQAKCLETKTNCYFL